MNVRGVEIRVVRAGADSAPGAPADEGLLRGACAERLAEAVAARKPYVALPAPGAGPGGLGPRTAGKVMVQEAIRVAREGKSGLREIRLGFPSAEGYGEFEKTVNGYLAHFLDTLIWGPFVVVDAIIETAAGVVLIERSNPPLGFALPGGFVDYGESLEQAVVREAREETGLSLLDLRQFHTYSDPGRDPRFHTITTVFAARAEGHPAAGDDAAAAREVPVQGLAELSFAFDHGKILQDWVRWRQR